MDTISQGNEVMDHKRDLIITSVFAYSHWKHRNKNINTRLREISSPFLFNRIRPRKIKNDVCMLLDIVGNWIINKKLNR